jgi:hypothetical protein
VTDVEIECPYTLIFDKGFAMGANIQFDFMRGKVKIVSKKKSQHSSRSNKASLMAREAQPASPLLFITI